VTDASTMLTSAKHMAALANMVASVKMNLEHFIATVLQDMVEHIVKRILTNVLINHVLMEEHASMQSMIFNVLAEKDFPVKDVKINVTIVNLNYAVAMEDVSMKDIHPTNLMLIDAFAIPGGKEPIVKLILTNALEMFVRTVEHALI